MIHLRHVGSSIRPMPTVAEEVTKCPYCLDTLDGKDQWMWACRHRSCLMCFCKIYACKGYDDKEVLSCAVCRHQFHRHCHRELAIAMDASALTWQKVREEVGRDEAAAIEHVRQARQSRKPPMPVRPNSWLYANCCPTGKIHGISWIARDSNFRERKPCWN